MQNILKQNFIDSRAYTSKVGDDSYMTYKIYSFTTKQIFVPKFKKFCWKEISS